MTKQVNSKNQIWFEQESGVVKVGFTQSFLDSLDQCWHIMPANTQKFRERGPLMVVETNDALVSIMAPVSANFVQWNNKAQNFPDQLTADDIVLEMTTGKVVHERPVAFANAPVAVAVDDEAWMMEPPAAPPRVQFNTVAGNAAGRLRANNNQNQEDLMRRVQEQANAIRRRENF